jgi:hypothetical protein
VGSSADSAFLSAELNMSHFNNSCPGRFRYSLCWLARSVIELVAIVPSSVRHSVKALTIGCAIIVDYPRMPEFA